MILKMFDIVSRLTLFIVVLILFTSCKSKDATRVVAVLSQKVELPIDVIVGAQNIAEYHPFLQGKTVGMVVNQTSVIKSEHYRLVLY